MWNMVSLQENGEQHFIKWVAYLNYISATWYTLMHTKANVHQHIKTITDTKPNTDLSLHLYSGQRVSLSLSLEWSVLDPFNSRPVLSLENAFISKPPKQSMCLLAARKCNRHPIWGSVKRTRCCPLWLKRSNLDTHAVTHKHSNAESNKK